MLTGFFTMSRVSRLRQLNGNKLTMLVDEEILI